MPEGRVIHMAQEQEGDGRQSHLLKEVDVKLAKKFDPSHLEDMDEKDEFNITNSHVDGGLPLISDSVFSLIIMVRSFK